MTIKERFQLSVVDEWKNCTDCDLHLNSARKVFYRGIMPCDILCIGNAPTDVDEGTGEPMNGNVRIFLRDLFHEATRSSIPVGYTTAVACRSLNGYGRDTAPNRRCLDSCAPRIGKTIDITKPEAIITFGVAAKSSITALRKTGYRYSDDVRVPPALHLADVNFVISNEHNFNLHRTKMLHAIQSFVAELGL